MRAFEELLTFAGSLADASGAVLRAHFRRPFAVESKADHTPVTDADREAEAVLWAAIEARYPHHGIRGEELGQRRMDAEYVWVLDPIDGTRSFITGKPLFVTLIGLLHHGQAVAGVIDQPINGERWIGRGAATTFNGAPVTVRDCADLAAAALYTTGPVDAFGPVWCSERDKAPLGRLIGSAGLVRYSADGYAFGLLAGGWIDLVAECGMEPHDFCAAIPVVQGAGGVITDWAGAPLDCAHQSNVLAAGSPALHGAALAQLRWPGSSSR